MGSNLVQQAVGLIFVLIYGQASDNFNKDIVYTAANSTILKLQAVSPADPIVPLKVKNVHSNAVESPDSSSWPHMSKSERVDEENSNCVWNCGGCKWQCNLNRKDQCRWKCSKCEWDCIAEEIEWTDNDSGNCSVTTTVPQKGQPVEKNATLYSLPNFQGDVMSLELQKIGDCVEFWNPEKTIPQNMKAFSDRGESIRLPEGLCVRLYENDCGWKYKGKTLDILPDSPWALRFGSVGMESVSAVQRIPCPTSAKVVLYDQRNFLGNSVNLTSLRNAGDCQDLWNPNGYLTLISNELRQFSDKAVSIEITGETCLRLYENECRQKSGRVLDIIPTNSNSLTDLYTHQCARIISAVEIIRCPVISQIFIYTKPNFEGESLQLPGLGKPGDCVDFWTPQRSYKPISDDLRRFNDKMHSIKIPIGNCVRLYENSCGSGRDLIVRPGTSIANNTSNGNMGGTVSSVELIKCP